MAQVIRRVSYFKLEAPQRPGEGAKVLGLLKDSGVNLLAFTGFPRGRRAQMDLIPEDEGVFRKAAKKAGLKISLKKTCFLVQGPDRVGAVYNLVSKMAEAGINITALDAVSAGGGRFGAIFWVDPRDVNKTARLLKAA